MKKILNTIIMTFKKPLFKKAICVVPFIVVLCGQFITSLCLSKFYFEKSLNLPETIICLALCFAFLGGIIKYSHSLLKVSHLKKHPYQAVSLFLFYIAHIIYLFTNLYLLVLKFDSTALVGIDAKTPFDLLFDISYFSAMTFIGGNTNIAPVTDLAQIIVLIESFVFAIYISIIIFNFSFASKDDTKAK